MLKFYGSTTKFRQTQYWYLHREIFPKFRVLGIMFPIGQSTYICIQYQKMMEIATICMISSQFWRRAS